MANLSDLMIVHDQIIHAQELLVNGYKLNYVFLGDRNILSLSNYEVFTKLVV
jgi:hypothetical protein